MGIFPRVGALLSDAAAAVGSAVCSLHDMLRAIGSAEARRDAAFAVAVIALSAKMAKADGVVSRSEVDAFCEILSVPPGEERNVSRVYNLAKGDVAGFDTYARDVRRIFAEDPAKLEDVLDGLFHIAKADGAVHDRELGYLEQIGGIFGFDDTKWTRIRERHVLGFRADPFLVLGADPSWDPDRLKRHYRKLVSENHPDRLIANGLPEEFVRIATDRLAAINTAWEQVERMRAVS